MGKKRKSDATGLDEVDRGMYATFCSAANSLSQLYTHAMHQQRLSFRAGERHSLEKLLSWILRQQQEGIRVMTGDVIAYIQNELEYGTEESLPPSPRLPVPQIPSTGLPTTSNTFDPVAVGQGGRDQPKNYVFSNALSSPMRRSLQHYHLSQGGHSSNSGTRSNENIMNQVHDANPPSSNDTSMDMHGDSPGHDSPY